MKLFRFYSTAKNNNKLGDSFFNLTGRELQSIKGYFDDDSDKKFFIIRVETDLFVATEAHDDEVIVRERLKLIMLAFDIPENEADKLSKEIRFLIA